MINILLINLETNHNRKQHSMEQFKKCNLDRNVNIIKATNAEEAKILKYNYISQYANNNIEKNFKNDAILPTWGAVGCAISHCRCWEYIIEQDLPYAMICEDDIEIVDIANFLFSVNKAIMYHKNLIYDNSLPGLNSSFLCKVKNLMTLIDAQPLEKNNIDCKIITPFTHSHCYIINQECCRYFLHKLIPITYQIDYQMGFLAKKDPNVLIYNIINGGTKQSNKFYSDTQYMFLSLPSLKKILTNIPDEACEIIHKYLPKKSYYWHQLINQSYNSNIHNVNHWYNYLNTTQFYNNSNHFYNNTQIYNNTTQLYNNTANGYMN